MKLRLLGFVTAAILVSALTTVAQVAKMEGTITGKGADGKVIPIEGAVVDIWRTDIKTEKPYTIKTNKSGDYVHAGIPYNGTYTILISAAGLGSWICSGRKARASTAQRCPVNPR